MNSRPICEAVAVPKHHATPEDLPLICWPSSAALSPGGDQVAWAEVSLDIEQDQPVSSIFVAPADGSGPVRRFSEGPGDFSPTWSPDGRFLAYLSAAGGPPGLKLAPLEGGEPSAVETPGPVSSIEWSPDGERLVLVVSIDRPEHEGKDDPVSRNAPRVIRGWFNRLDGAGWLSGRDHLFSYEVATEELRQLTSGDYSHAQPSFSPDGSLLAFVSDRSSSRDDHHSDADVWTIPLNGRGGRRRVATDVSNPAFPTFSPDGRYVAFSGLPGRETTAGRESRLLVVPADGSEEPAVVAPGLDRPVAFGLMGRAFVWSDDDELVFAVAERGAVGLRRARLGDRTAKTVLAGDRQISGLTSTRGSAGDTVLAFTSVWVDSPAEIYTLRIGRRAGVPQQVSEAGAGLASEVKMLPAKRYSATAPDGLEVEYFVVAPPRRRGSKNTAKPPLLLEIHGGPHLYNPLCEMFFSYQVMAAAGYSVVLPNPRGSISYGERFSLMARGDWGEGPFLDLMACVDDAVQRGLADKRWQFVSGYSYGGYMSSWVVGHTGRFKGAAIGAPVTSFTSLFGTWDGGPYLDDALAGDPWKGYEHLRAQSPVTYAPAVSTPVYLYVNEGDMRCPPSQTDEFFAALKWHRKEVEYVRYPGGSHLSTFAAFGPPSQNIDRLERILSFFARHGGPKAPAAG